ncbi:MAG: hypothetical protein ACRDIY_17805 [Chloroflexota bacterium]
MIVKRMAERDCHRARAAFAGFTAGYVMALAGYWLEAVFGVSDLALAHNALRYVSGGKQGWWIVGIIFHLIDSVLLGLLYATRIYPRLRWLTTERDSVRGNVAAGLAFATGVWLVMAMLIAMPFLGAGIFGRRTGSARPALASLSLHVIFGALLGYIYGVRDC